MASPLQGKRKPATTEYVRGDGSVSIVDVSTKEVIEKLQRKIDEDSLGLMGVIGQTGKESVTASVLASSSPLMAARYGSGLALTYDQIDRLGDAEAVAVGSTANKIVKAIALSDMEELGDIMASMQVQGDRLNPDKYKEGGWTSKIKGMFVDIKKQLKKELQTAEVAFTEIESKISKHINTQVNWVQNLEAMYQENYQRYRELTNVLGVLDNYEQSVKKDVETFVVSESDPEFAMKLQQLQDLKNLLHRILVKKDNILRLRALCEGNSPKIRQRQEDSRAVITTLKDVVTQIIPILKIEFALYIQTLDTQKSINFISNTRTLANKTLTSSADQAYTSSVEAAKALNQSSIETETLVHIRDKMLSSMREVATVRNNFMLNAEAAANAVKQTQAEFLSELTKIQ